MGDGGMRTQADRAAFEAWADRAGYIASADRADAWHAGIAWSHRTKAGTSDKVLTDAFWAAVNSVDVDEFSAELVRLGLKVAKVTT